MKTFLAICIVVALTVSAAIAVDETVKIKVISAFRKCREVNPVTDAEVELVKSRAGIPNSPEAKCMAKCMLETFKLMKDGRFLKEVAKTFADAAYGSSPDHAEKIKQGLEFCADNVGFNADACEYSYNLAVCGYNKAKEAGLQPVQ